MRRGRELPDEEITRAALFLKINNLAKGHAGIKLKTLKTLVAVYNSVCPLMPEKGSVGSKRHRAPLAHMALVLVGQGQAIYKGTNFHAGLPWKRRIFI